MIFSLVFKCWYSILAIQSLLLEEEKGEISVLVAYYCLQTKKGMNTKCTNYMYK